ncbi:hypothetical protein LTR66_000481 [Elasticomyces elasticus]|nr:hypothetical protein LTR66_000481 [Elasticomyces elasticus]
MKWKQGDSLFDAECSVHSQLHKRWRISDPTRGAAGTALHTNHSYRASNLFRANISVEVELPADVGARIEQILQKPAGEDGRQSAIADKLCSKSNELVRGSAGEAEWRDIPDGINDLTPPVHNPPPAKPRKRKQQRDSIEPSNRDTSGAAVRYPSPHASAQTTQSDPLHFPAERAEAAMLSIPIFKLQAPRPDMCVGLSDELLVEAIEPLRGRNAAKTFLADLQDNATLISNPFVTSLGLRFLFLVVEAKFGATGGNLYQAQNQAAVCGAAALRIKLLFKSGRLSACATRLKVSRL